MIHALSMMLVEKRWESTLGTIVLLNPYLCLSEHEVDLTYTVSNSGDTRLTWPIIYLYNQNGKNIIKKYHKISRNIVVNTMETMNYSSTFTISSICNLHVSAFS